MKMSSPEPAYSISTVLNELADDPHTPRYHFISPTQRSRCFDPNGAIYWKGRYHLFYIFQDQAYRSGPEFWQQGHCWGHASSADLLHWEFHPTALIPEHNDPEVAIYSGCALLNKEGVPTLVYHGYGAGTCIATALDDNLNQWQKSSHNPVIVEPKQVGDDGWGVYNVFDPNVWLEGETYFAILGGQVKPQEQGDAAYLFRSDDLLHWEYLHPFYAPNPQWTTAQDDCACPKFFSLNGNHVLLCISHATGTRYYIGDYRDHTFIPSAHHVMNWPGGCCFAPETVLDESGRRVMFAWAIEQRRNEGEQRELGVMTLPRILSFEESGRLRIEPPVEIEGLRRNPVRLDNLDLDDGQEISLPQVAGNCLEIMLEAALPKGAMSAQLGLKVRVSPEGNEQTTILYDFVTGELRIDVSRSSLSSDGWRPWPLDYWRGIPYENQLFQSASHPLAPGETLQLRVFLDHSILEVFANNRLCLTQRIYPSRADSLGTALFASGAALTLPSLQAWEMKPTLF
jgi:sucrose-6-phosphate hydrolase SacC (GH32 family)